MSELERRNKCPICFSLTEPLYNLAGFECVRCIDCHTESLVKLPTVEDLIAFYGGRSGRKTKRWEQRMARVDRAFDAYIRDYHEASANERPSTFLDAGGGVGYYAKAAQNRGTKACLLDYDETALQFARETLGVKETVQGDAAACLGAKGEGAFEYILARHVIEHVLSPQDFLRDLSRLLKPGGYLQVETPNSCTKEQWAHLRQIQLHYGMIRRSNVVMSAGTALRLACEKSMSGINPPKHLWGFSPEGLRILLENAGFEVKKITCVIAGDGVYDPLYYEEQRLGARRGLGIPYYFYEKIVSPIFQGRGMNLVMLASFSGKAK